MFESTAADTIGSFPAASSRDALEKLLQKGAHSMLAVAIEAEVSEYIHARRGVVYSAGRRQVVRNGNLPQRFIRMPLGSVPVWQHRVRDRRREQQRVSFCSKVLPAYLRQTRSIEELIPWLYLKGVSTGDVLDALRALLGDHAAGLFAATVMRLKSSWQGDCATWSTRSFRGCRYVYFWADG